MPTSRRRRRHSRSEEHEDAETQVASSRKLSHHCSACLPPRRVWGKRLQVSNICRLLGAAKNAVSVAAACSRSGVVPLAWRPPGETPHSTVSQGGSGERDGCRVARGPSNGLRSRSLLREWKRRARALGFRESERARESVRRVSEERGGSNQNPSCTC